MSMVLPVCFFYLDFITKCLWSYLFASSIWSSLPNVYGPTCLLLLSGVQSQRVRGLFCSAQPESRLALLVTYSNPSNQCFGSGSVSGNVDLDPGTKKNCDKLADKSTKIIKSGSADPDPHQNYTDPKHCFKYPNMIIC